MLFWIQHLRVQPDTTSKSMWALKKRESSASEESDRLPPHVTPGSGVWQSVLPTWSPSRGKAPCWATQMGQSRVQTLVSPLHWLMSTWCRCSQQGPGWNGRFIHEKCNTEAILSDKLTLHRHTHSEESRTRWNKGSQSHEASPVFKKRKKWKQNTGARKEMNGRETWQSLRWMSWIWNRLGYWGNNTVGQKN